MFDWNQIDQAKSLGTAKIDLEDLEPLTAIERILALSSEKHGSKGQIKISMVFQPGIIMKSRKSTSTFSAAGRTMTAIGGAPISAGKGVLQGVAGVFKRGKDGEDERGGFFGFGGSPSESKSVAPNVPNVPGTQVSQPVGEGEGLAVPAASDTNGHSAPQEPGILRVSILEAKDLTGGPDVKPYAVVRLGEKEFKTKHTGKTVAPEWYVRSRSACTTLIRFRCRNESFEFAVGPSTTRLHVMIFDHKTLGKDKSLGEAEVDVSSKSAFSRLNPYPFPPLQIWQHIQPVSSAAANVSVEIMNGHGVLTLRLAFSAEPAALGRKSSVSYADHSSATLTSPSRFSLRGRRPDKEE